MLFPELIESIKHEIKKMHEWLQTANNYQPLPRVWDGSVPAVSHNVRGSFISACGTEVKTTQPYPREN